MTMTFPRQAIEACEGLSHPLPFPSESECGSDPEKADEADEISRRFDKWIDTHRQNNLQMLRDWRPTTDDATTEWLHRKEGGAKVDTAHPGPIVMLERPSLAKRLLRRHGAIVAGALFAMVVIGPAMSLTPDVSEQLLRLAR